MSEITTPIVLTPEPLTKEAFRPFGSVIETEGTTPIPINQGTTLRYNALAQADPGEDGTAIISIFVGTPIPYPIPIKMMERHPLGAQSFIPLHKDTPWLVIVAEKPEVSSLRCFVASGNQGVKYNKNVWHHPLLAAVPNHSFLVVDRSGPGNNLEERDLVPGAVIQES